MNQIAPLSNNTLYCILFVVIIGLLLPSVVVGSNSTNNNNNNNNTNNNDDDNDNNGGEAVIVGRTNTNFAFGGARTNNENRRLENNPEWSTDFDNAGLTLIGLSQQLDYAYETLYEGNDDDVQRTTTQNDLFFVSCGSNDFDRLVWPSNPAKNIGRAMERLYHDLNARNMVVSGLFNIGRMPLLDDVVPVSFLFAPMIRYIASLWVRKFNRALRNVVDDFNAQYPDATVVFVNIYDVTEAHVKESGLFTNVDETCQNNINFEEDPSQTCAGFLWVDDVHPTSAFWEPVAELYADIIMMMFDDKNFERFIIFGESFYDMGSHDDVWFRTFDVRQNPSPLYYQGRYTDGPNVLDQTESLLDMEQKASFFVQPLVESVVLLEVPPPLGISIHSLEGSTSINQLRNYIIPSNVVVDIDSGSEIVPTMNLIYNSDGGDASVTCDYKFDDGSLRTPSFAFQSCTNNSLVPGTIIQVTGTVQVQAFGTSPSTNQMILKLYYYDLE